jgi:hypothetical protein
VCPEHAPLPVGGRTPGELAIGACEMDLEREGFLGWGETSRGGVRAGQELGCLLAPTQLERRLGCVGESLRGQQGVFEVARGLRAREVSRQRFLVGARGGVLVAAIVEKCGGECGIVGRTGERERLVQVASSLDGLSKSEVGVAQTAERGCLSCAVARVPGERERLLEGLERGGVLAPELLCLAEAPQRVPLEAYVRSLGRWPPGSLPLTPPASGERRSRASLRETPRCPARVRRGQALRAPTRVRLELRRRAPRQRAAVTGPMQPTLWPGFRSARRRAADLRARSAARAIASQ